MNNTWLIGNVLVSEDISPVPVLLEIQVQELRNRPMQSFSRLHGGDQRHVRIDIQMWI